jgi:hypothetical protein
MLFDLKGRRRRVIQATYLTLAVLMGGGLVLFGIGGEVQGGLLDAFTDRDGGGQGNPVIEKRLKAAEARLKANPNDQRALEDVARSRFQLAGDDVNPNTGLYGPDARRDLDAAAQAWQRYLATDPSPPDVGLARVMVQVYGSFGLNKPKEAARAAGIVAEADPSPQAYIQLAQYAALAGDERQADLAGKRAVSVAPKQQKKAVERQLKEIEAAAKQAQAQQAGGAGGAAGGGGLSGGAGGR